MIESILLDTPDTRCSDEWLEVAVEIMRDPVLFFLDLLGLLMLMAGIIFTFAAIGA
jgi:hypothetical protein